MAGQKVLSLAGIILLVLLSNLVKATESATDKETRWADQIVDGLVEGDEVWLNDGNHHEFLGILTEPETAPARAVIIVHGIGAHPDWPEVIYPLRTGLPARGLTTLSIQMPVLPNDAEDRSYVPLFAETSDRFTAAIKYLEELGYRKISIVAHSMGATMSTHYLASAQPDSIQSYVAIGMGFGISETPINNVQKLKKITLPILDIYGSDDLASVLDSSQSRALSAGSVNKQYSQKVVEGAGHFFVGFEAILVDEIEVWLRGKE